MPEIQERKINSTAETIHGLIAVISRRQFETARLARSLNPRQFYNAVHALKMSERFRPYFKYIYFKDAGGNYSSPTLDHLLDARALLTDPETRIGSGLAYQQGQYEKIILDLTKKYGDEAIKELGEMADAFIKAYEASS